VNDEGILHRVISFIVQFNPPFEDIMRIYKSLYHVDECVYVYSSVERAYSNIKKRNLKTCLMDEMDDNLLKEYISAFYDICERINNPKLLYK
jgi:hypothetical protein